MEAALRYKGAYRMDFKDKKGRTHAPAFQPENVGEEKTVPYHHQSISAAVADRGIFQVQETAVWPGGSAGTVHEPFRHQQLSATESQITTDNLV